MNEQEKVGHALAMLTMLPKQLCRCAGCHSAPIQAVIDELFPRPCG